MGKGRGRRSRGEGLVFDEAANGLDEVLEEEEHHEARKRCYRILCSGNKQLEYSPLETQSDEDLMCLHTARQPPSFRLRTHHTDH
jgi:hypothetical protein